MVSMKLLLETSDTVISSVVLLRHCVRSSSTYPPRFNKVMPEGYSNDAAHYTAEVWPGIVEWGVPAGECTDLGLQYSKDMAEVLEETLTAPFQFVVDKHSNRDIQTANAVISGLKEVGIEPAAVTYSDVYRYTTECQLIHNITTTTKTAKAQLNAFPHTQVDYERSNLLQSMLGNDGAYQLSDIPIEVIKGPVAGRTEAEYVTAETFLMERMAGIRTAWGKASDEDVLSLARLCSRYWVYYSEYDAAVRFGRLYANMFNTLDTARGTTVYVGHESNIGGLNYVLGLEYDDPVYGAQAAVPNSRLVFKLHETKSQKRYVTARYFSIDLDGKETTREGTPVTFHGSTTMSRIPHKELQDILHAKLISGCV
eukprot:CFRG0492T1